MTTRSWWSSSRKITTAEEGPGNTTHSTTGDASVEWPVPRTRILTGLAYRLPRFQQHYNCHYENWDFCIKNQTKTTTRQPRNKHAEQIEQGKAHPVLTEYLNFASMHQRADLDRIILNRAGKEEIGCGLCILFLSFAFSKNINLSQAGFFVT